MKILITYFLSIYCFSLSGQIPETGNETIKDCKIIVEEMPLFEGCDIDSLSYVDRKKCSDLALLKFIYKIFRYPKELNHCYYTRVIIQFTIQKDGCISNLKFPRKSHPSLEKEARRIIQIMSKWTPGKVNGIPVDVCYTLPIRLEIRE